jgi:hypothetical protein
MKYARTLILAFLATGAMVQATPPATRTPAAPAPLLVSGRLNAKGAKPIQSITVRIMPSAVFQGQPGSVYVSHRSESSCVAWVDQDAVAGKKKTAGGKDVLQAAFDACGTTFE